MATSPSIEGLPRWIARGVVVAVALFLAFGASGGPGWTPASDHAVIAVQLQQIAAAPLYGLVTSVASCLPVGEIGFRLAVANALLGAVAVAGVLRAARALLPRDPLAGLAGAVVLVVVPPFREAAAIAGPSMLATAGAVWAIALALEHARTPAPRLALGAIASAGVVAGAAPWGLGLGVLIGAWLWQRTSAEKGRRLRRRAERTKSLVVLAAGVFGAVAIVWWWRALGEVAAPGAHISELVEATGRGAAAVVVGAGLLGVAFGAATDLPHARWLGGAILISVFAFQGDAVPLLGLLAIPIAIIPSGVARVMPTMNRTLIALTAGLPLVGAAIVAGAAITIDDPGDAPARLATDVIGHVPPGPGLAVITRPATWSAITHAQVIAGARPDLELAPLGLAEADSFAVNAVRAGSHASSDVAGFGLIDSAFVMPRGRGFQILLDKPTRAPPRADAPARYPSKIGEREAALLALSRAAYEKVAGRLDNAARALGLAEKRFGSAELAILATTALVHPPLFSFIPPLDGGPPGPWLIDLYGDDLAWIAGLELDKPAAESPGERRLHALWRALLLGKIRRSDPALAALGPVAAAATDTMLAALARPVVEEPTTK